MTPGAFPLADHIDRIYQAAVVPERWPAFLEPLARELRVRSLHLSFRLPNDAQPGVIVSWGMDERLVEAYCTHFHRMDPWMARIGREPEGEIHALDEFVPESELMRTEFYNDWMRPQDILHGFGALLFKSAPSRLISSLSGFRDASSGRFEKQELARILSLVPHLQRALALHDRLRAAELRARATEDALDHMPGGVIVFDQRGAPLVTNRVADQILARGDGLRLDRDGPRAASAAQTGELRRALAHAAQTGAGKATNPGAAMRLARPSGRAPLDAVVAPIRVESSSLFDRRAAAAIFIAEPRGQVDDFCERLRGLYGFTRMEAEVASRLSAGMRIPEIGESLGVTVHTVRGHLKQLFAKTDTHRQADLVQLLSAGAARLLLD